MDTMVKECNPTGDSIKLCGYLKKKRTKVGGWRKLWFVLQDKLLLSYGSKEEYDNKLVSFKDVLNLVPGTLIKPLGGYRFTIETTSQAMYTFHCDDRNAYREWITMLLDSLSKQPSIPQPKFSQRFSNYSVDNIPNQLAQSYGEDNLNQGTMAKSFDCVSQLERVPSAVGHSHSHSHLHSHSHSHSHPHSHSLLSGSCVRLPIAHSTAKILERNGVNPSAIDVQMQMQMHQCQNQQKNKNFYCQRNQDEHHRQYRVGLSAKSLYHASEVVTTEMAAPTLSNHLFHSSTTDINWKEFHETNKYTTSNSNFELDKMREWRSDRRPLLQSTSYTQSRTFGCSSPNGRSLQTTSCSKKCGATLNTTANDQMDLIKIKNPVGRQPTNESNVEDGNIYFPKPEPVYAVVDLKNKYAQRQLKQSKIQLLRHGSYSSIFEKEFDLEKPIKSNKVEKRQSAICNDIEGIYEDSELFYNKELHHSHHHPQDDLKGDDNIYEPINVSPNKSQQPNVKTIWKYFTRLKVTPLLELARPRKRQTSDYDKIKLPVVTSQLNSHFNNFRHKFGTHRKSMQVRVRKLCSRASYEPKPFFKHHNLQTASANTTAVPSLTTSINNVSSKSKKPKYHWKSVKIKPKHFNAFRNSNENNSNKGRMFFGSLPHLPKGRVSLFNSKHIITINDDNEPADTIKTKLKTNVKESSQII